MQGPGRGLRIVGLFDLQGAFLSRHPEPERFLRKVYTIHYCRLFGCGDRRLAGADLSGTLQREDSSKAGLGDYFFCI